MKFKATEAGDDSGLCGASNSSSEDDYHYVLFGKDGDGIYFEFDDQANGKLNMIKEVLIDENSIEFILSNSDSITVVDGIGGSDWNDFLKGTKNIFKYELTGNKNL